MRVSTIAGTFPVSDEFARDLDLPAGAYARRMMDRTLGLALARRLVLRTEARILGASGYIVRPPRLTHAPERLCEAPFDCGCARCAEEVTGV